LKPRALYYACLSYQPSNVTLLHRVFDVATCESPDHDAEAPPSTEVLFAPLGWRVSADRMNRFPRLRAIVSNTTGVPHIDLDAADARGICVCALHDEQPFLERITPTAEHTIGLLMAAWRRLPGAHAAACAGRWDRRPWGAPRMLSRMSLGIVGHGRLGRRVGRIAEAIGMQVAFYDPHQRGSLPDVRELAARSDILTLHAPGNAQTAGLISRGVLESLPKGAMIVNTARGELLDTDALLDLLEAEHLHAAALDTVAGEYEPGFAGRFETSRLARYARTHDNLILTPHIGGSTVDAWFETERRVIEKCCRVLAIECPQ
jgi:D-3-phosphoglycerate dehydrogenase